MLLPFLVSACVSVTRREFIPTSGQERLTPTDLRTRGDAFVRLECPRLIGRDSTATGAALFVITVDREGNVLRARLDRTSGDDRMDQVFGGMTAELRFDPPTGMRGATMQARTEVGYSCSPATSTITFRIMPPEGEEPALTPTPEGRGGK